MEKHVTQPTSRGVLDPKSTTVLARVAHEMRQPLSAVSAAITALKDDGDLHHMLADLTEALRPSVELKAQQHDVLLSLGPCWVHGDSVRLEQVFSNILNNAIKYTDEGGRIWLTSLPSDGGVVVTVADTGHGIPPDMLSRVFDMFTSGEDQTSGGLGVGLAVARHLVNLHGGSIDISSEGSQRGTEVFVRLPCIVRDSRSPAGEEPVTSRRPAAHEHVRRILDRIEESYSEPITLQSLAAELHRQSAYVGDMFRRTVGMLVHQWLTAVRLDRASALIREGVKVEAVSLLVGYRSKKNFYRQFKRRFGTTPCEHRNGGRNVSTPALL